MSTEFDTERLVVPVTHNGKTVTYYVRELGYYEFQEINQEAAVEHPTDKERRGLAVLHRTAVAAIEDKEGNPAFTALTWKRLKKEPARELTHKVMLAQGIDLQTPREDEDEDAPEDDAGNA